MTYSNSIEHRKEPIVIDTSVLINIKGSTFGEKILDTIPNKVLVPQAVSDEFTCGKGHIIENCSFFEKLIRNNLIDVLSLTEDEFATFKKHTIASKSLGDGEASVISVAIGRKYFPIIDDLKGRKLLTKLTSGQIPGWSLDLFRHSRVLDTLGRDNSIQALHLALINANMHISHDHLQYVYDIIGIENAERCSSLPIKSTHLDNASTEYISKVKTTLMKT